MMRMPIATRPWNARSSRFDSSTLAASTVEENESAIASIRAVFQGTAMSR